MRRAWTHGMQRRRQLAPDRRALALEQTVGSRMKVPVVQCVCKAPPRQAPSAQTVSRSRSPAVALLQSLLKSCCNCCPADSSRRWLRLIAVCQSETHRSPVASSSSAGLSSSTSASPD